jgi:hypothetical protein
MRRDRGDAEAVNIPINVFPDQASAAISMIAVAIKPTLQINDRTRKTPDA